MANTDQFFYLLVGEDVFEIEFVIMPVNLFRIETEPDKFLESNRLGEQP